MSSPQREVQVLTPNTCEHDLIWKQGLAAVIKLRLINLPVVMLATEIEKEVSIINQALIQRLVSI